MRDRHLLRVVVICAAGCLLLIGLAFCTGCAASRTGKAFNVAVMGSGVADLVTTHQALQRGATELNPIMQGPEWRRWLVKGASDGMVIGFARMLERNDMPVTAHLLRVFAIAAQVAVAIQNHRVVR